MIFMKYKQPKAEYVQFQRLVLGLLVLVAAVFQEIFFIKIFLGVSIISFFTTVNYSPTTLIFKLTSMMYSEAIFTTPQQYVHSYLVHRLAYIFEDLMRISGGLAIIYFYQMSETSAWVISSFMAIAMLISSFFGFCLSALIYIAYTSIEEKFKS